MPMPCPSDMPEVLNALLPRLRVRARRLAGHSGEAEDLMQETLLAVWLALRQRHGIAEPERYAMTVLHNRARRGWRARVPTVVLEEDMACTDPLAPARLAWSDLAAAIDRLPPAQARLLHLIAEGEASPAALARRTGVPPGTVMSRLARARATLRTDLGLGRDAPVSELL